MPGMSRSMSGLAAKKNPLRPPSARPSTARIQSNAPMLHSRTQSGAVSPAESILSISTNTSHSRSPVRQNGGTKRKERDFDGESGEETNIHVVVRCRGRSDREVKENSGVVVSTEGVKGKSVELSMGLSALSNKTYHFDKVFSPAADQVMIYEDVVTPLLDEVSVLRKLNTNADLIPYDRCCRATIAQSLLMVRLVLGKHILCPAIC